MPRAFFEQVADALVGFLPTSLRSFSALVGSTNLKVWYGEQTAEHYEVQLISAQALRAGGVAGARGRSVLEIGFHAEHPRETANEQALARLVGGRRAWRDRLGTEPEAGPFIGRQRAWRRLSELWREGNLTGPEAAIEAAERLANYIAAFEPLRTGSR